MDKEFIFYFAFKNLLSHKLRSLLTIGGITIGISAIVFLVSFAFGIEKLVTSEVTKGNAFKLIDVGSAGVKALKLNKEVQKELAAIGGISAVESSLTVGGELVLGAKREDLTISASSDKYFDWTGGELAFGKGLSSMKSESIRPAIITKKIADLMGEKDYQSLIGKYITADILITKEISGGEVIKANDIKFEIVGLSPDTNSIIYVPLQSILDLGAINFSQIKVEVNSTEKQKIDWVREKIEGLGYKTQYVGDTVSQIQQVFSIFKIILGGFGLIALIVAALGMFNTLTISLLERTKEVALLKILGTKKKDIKLIFVVEALILGLVGGVLGILVGILATRIIDQTFIYFSNNMGGENVSIFFLPWWFALGSWIFAVSIAFITGLYPANRAAVVNPLDTLRNE